MEGDERREVESREIEREPVELDEGLVVVARDRLPDGGVLAAEVGPAELVPVAVPVAQVHVHQASAEKRPGVHPMVGTLIDPAEEAGGRDDSLGPQSLCRVGRRGRPLLEQPQDTFPLVPELAERRIVGRSASVWLSTSTPAETSSGLATSGAPGNEALTPSCSALA
jgi:hypothetical protein